MEKISDNPTTYKNHRTEPYFTYVKEGSKTVEGRLRKNLYAELQPGDHIHVHTNDETNSVLVEVVALRHYPSFAEMLEHETLARVLPNATFPEHGVAIYEEFYPPSDQAKYGIVAIEIKRV